jgi:hypothetical protein
MSHMQSLDRYAEARWEVVVGRHDRVIEDSTLRFSHSAGTEVAVMQPLVHARLGALGYIWPRHWVAHLGRADAAYERLVELHDRLEDVPVDNGNRRLLPVDDYLFDVYGTGTDMVVNSALTVQHLAEEIERSTTPVAAPGPVAERIRNAAMTAGLGEPADQPGWAGFVEIVKVRDAVEHPKPGNTYNGQDGQWDRVPLAWMLSERPLAAYGRFGSLVDWLAGEWETTRERLKKPGTLTASQRGLRSELQAKRQRQQPPA